MLLISCMDYLAITKRFDIDKFITEQIGNDLLPLLRSVNEQAKFAEDFRAGRNNPYKRDIENVRQRYMFAMKGFSFFLQHQIAPTGVEREIFLKFKPVIVSLVERKQFPEKTLDLFAQI